MDRESMLAISSEADQLIRRAHRLHSNKFANLLVGDADDTIIQIYKQLRIQSGWIENVPEKSRKPLWSEVWQLALKEGSIKKRVERMTATEFKWWRDGVREKANSRFDHEVKSGTLTPDMSPAVKAFYEPETNGEIVFPLNLKIEIGVKPLEPNEDSEG